MKMCDNARLEAIVNSVGKNYGHDQIKAQFYPFKELKSTWKRNGSQLSLRVSDYLRWADEQVVEDYACSLFCRMKSKNRRELYGEAFKNWIQSKEFVEKNRPIYLQRSRNLKLSSSGSTFNLDEIRYELEESRLIKNSSDAYLTWTINGNRNRVGYCSVIMKVIAISSVLDSPSVPSIVPAYVLYHEMLHLEMNSEHFFTGHGSEFRRRERMFPKWNEAELWLKKIAKERVTCGDTSFIRDVKTK
ncbi:MAG: hypothetical protein NO474_00220 [Methanomassiliicoccales archaeon]|nr:hypothetical protein [Methanomassiliicoccales archaeon]